jgi:hypothetical protein
MSDYPNLSQAGEYLSDEDARRFDLDFGLRSKSVGIASAAQKANAAYQMAQIKQLEAELSEKRREYDATLGFDREKFTEDTRRYNQDFGEGVRRFDTTTGLDVLKAGASLRGSEDVFQGQAFARGVQGNGLLSPALAALRNGFAPAYGGGTATTANPTPLTTQTLSNDLTGQGNSPADQALAPAQQGAVAAPGAARPGGASTDARGGASIMPVGAPGVVRPAAAPTDAYGRPLLPAAYQQNLDAINSIAQRGLANLPQGAWENLSDSEKKAYISGSDYLGRDTASELAFWKRSRAGQGNALGA